MWIWQFAVYKMFVLNDYLKKKPGEEMATLSKTSLLLILAENYIKVMSRVI